MNQDTWDEDEARRIDGRRGSRSELRQGEERDPKRSEKAKQKTIQWKQQRKLKRGEK